MAVSVPQVDGLTAAGNPVERSKEKCHFFSAQHKFLIGLVALSTEFVVLQFKPQEQIREHELVTLILPLA